MVSTTPIEPLPEVRREVTEALRYGEALERTFERAANAVGGVEVRDFAIAGCAIRLRFAGSAAIAKMTPGIAHLAITAAEAPSLTPDLTPDLTIDIWDGASTGVEVPPAPWRDDPNAYGAHGEVRGYDETRVSIAFNMFFDALSFLDRDRDYAAFYVRDVAAIPFWETAAPLRVLLHWWLSGRGLHFTHAAMVGIEAGGALLVGKGGSGKSTTALACLDSDLRYVSDDYCLLSGCLLSGAPEPRAYSLYSSAKIRPGNTHLPHLLPLAYNQEREPDEKPFVLLHEHFPEKLAPSLPVKAILVPHVTGQPDTQIAPTKATAALLALAPSTIFQLPGGDTAQFQEMAALVRAVPCYSIALGTDLAQIPRAIATLLEQVVS
ncbi:MAG: serine kinase [Geitlerinemataceae cyanobacterium]